MHVCDFISVDSLIQYYSASFCRLVCSVPVSKCPLSATQPESIYRKFFPLEIGKRIKRGRQIFDSGREEKSNIEKLAFFSTDSPKWEVRPPRSHWLHHGPL